MSGEGKKKMLLDLTEDDFKSLLASSFSEALSKLESKKEKEEPKTNAKELTVREVIEHALSCESCGKPLRDFIENRLSKFKEELLKEVSEVGKKKEERRGGLFE
jgi:hypothetical protein